MLRSHRHMCACNPQAPNVSVCIALAPTLTRPARVPVSSRDTFCQEPDQSAWYLCVDVTRNGGIKGRKVNRVNRILAGRLTSRTPNLFVSRSCFFFVFRIALIRRSRCAKLTRVTDCGVQGEVDTKTEEIQHLKAEIKGMQEDWPH